MFRLLIDTIGIQIWPKLNERFRIGPVTGDCEEHILDNEGKCVRIKMRDVFYTTEFLDMDERDMRECCSSWGVVECPHIPHKFCNCQFEDGSHCEVCQEKLEHINLTFLNSQARFKCPIMKDFRISTCYEGANIEGSDLRDKCIACCEEAMTKRDWDISSRCIHYTDVNRVLFRDICSQYIVSLETRLDCVRNYCKDIAGDDEYYVVEDYIIFQTLMLKAAHLMGIQLGDDDVKGGLLLERAKRHYMDLAYEGGRRD